MLDWTGLGGGSCVFLLFVFPSCRPPPHSVLGHGLGNRAAKIEARDRRFSVFVSFSSCRRPPQPRARGVARVIWILILWHRTVCFFFIFFVMYVTLFSLRHAFSARHFPPSRDCGLCHLCFSCWFSPFRLAHRHDGCLREGFDVGVLVVIAPAFSFNSPFFVSPLHRHAGGSREVFYGGLPYYSAFLRLAPPPRWRYAGCFLRWFALL